MIQPSGRLDLDLINFAKMNLKNDKITNNLPFNNLTINDIDQQKISIQNFSKIFFEIFENLYIERSKLGSLQNFKFLGVESLDQFKAESRIKFDRATQNNAKKTCEIALIKFNSGETFGSVIASAYIEKDPPLFSERDFVGLKCGFQHITQAQADERLKIDKNRARLYYKKVSNDRQKFVSNVNKNGGEWKLIMQVSAFYFSEQFKGSKERSEDHLIENYTSIVETFKNYELEKQKKASEEAYKALCLEQERKENEIKTKTSPKVTQSNKAPSKALSTSSASSSGQAKKTVSQAKKNPVVDVKTLERLQLNTLLNSKNSSPYFLHSRIRRWDVQDSSLIKSFVDTVEGTLVKKYQNMSQDQLVQQQACHNLGGILPLLANEKLLDMYSFKYNARSNTSEEGIGRCFYTEMQFKGTKNLGTIQLGIGKKHVVYHAQFTPINLDRRPEIKDFFVSTKNVEGLDEEEENKWEQISPCTFDILENNMLVMSVKKHAVKFIIHPLS